MFSVLNEIGNNSSFRTTSVVVTSVGVSAFIYVLVAITGYLSFGNAVLGNIVGMCKYSLNREQSIFADPHRFAVGVFDNRQSRYRDSCHVLLSLASASMQGFCRCRAQMAPPTEIPVTWKIAAQRYAVDTDLQARRQCSTRRYRRDSFRRYYHRDYRAQLYRSYDSLVA